MNIETRINAIIITLVIFGIVAVLSASVLDYYSACRKAEVINQRKDTNYTCGDIFWAGEVIEKQVQTINLNK